MRRFPIPRPSRSLAKAHTMINDYMVRRLWQHRMKSSGFSALREMKKLPSFGVGDAERRWYLYVDAERTRYLIFIRRAASQ